VSLHDLHVIGAWVTILSNAFAGLWATGAHWFAPLRSRWLWWAVVAAEATIFVQVALGVAMVAIQDLHAQEFHMFYGFVAIITVGLLFAYRLQLTAWLYLLYGLGGLFLMGLCIRALTLTI
jgi:hypothetical protein